MSTSKLVFDAHLHILDRQILDDEQKPVATVADLELTDVPFRQHLTGNEAAPTITNLLCGPILATRVFGGRPPSDRWYRIPWTAIAKIAVTIELNVKRDSMDVSWVERWVRDRIISRIPGGKR
ncbi:MAG TPA: hypothetical protein VN045_07155 [Microbacteriaceae bacterium]|nr:hypothetical protein [Microbacteriaceae bacterium]